MSQPNDTEANGPTADVGPRPGPYEGVKVAHGGNYPPQSTPQSTPFAQQPSNQQSHYQQPIQNFSPQRPLIRRTDSRGSIPYRPPGPGGPPFPNQPPPQQTIRPPPQQLQPRSPSQTGNFTPRPVGRFPAPGQTGQPPIRYGQYELQQGAHEGNFRRAVNTVTEGRFQRPPIQLGPRSPSIYPQKSLPQQSALPSEQTFKKSYTLDNSEVQPAPCAVTDEQNGVKMSANKKPIEVTTNKQTYDDIRSSSSLGFNKDTDNEKDIDTSILNGKSSNKDEIIDRPESRTGFLSRDHSSHSSMQKIDEDDDDAVVIPSRTVIQSGKPTHISNSSENIPQKTLDVSKSESIKSSSRPIAFNETTRTESQKSLDLNKPDITMSPVSSKVKSDTNQTHFSELQGINKTSPSPIANQIRSIPEPVLHPSNLVPKEKLSRTSSPIPPGKQDTSRVDMPDQQRQVPAEIKPQISTTSPMPKRESPSPVNKKLLSPRFESSNIVNGRKTPTSKFKKTEGDNDSGVDESTQGNDRSFNGEQSSPKKTPSKVPTSKTPTKCKTPIKMLQSPKSPDPSNSMSLSTEKKKMPMNKIQVGAAPSPNIKTVKSKIGSLENASHKPGGGKVRLENRKIDFSKVQPKIAAKNDQYTPGGGDKKSFAINSVAQNGSGEVKASNLNEIQQQKLTWNAKSKIGSLDNATYKPGGGDKKIESVKLDFKDKAKPKVGSKDNMKHIPGGGDVKSVEEEQENQIETKKVELNVTSKIGSLDNVKHKPGGGDIKIFDDKEYLRQKTSGEQSTLSGSQSSLRSQQSQPEPAEPVSDENLNQER